MSRADELRAQFEADLAVAELEDELVRLKEAVRSAGDPEAADDEGDRAELRRVKNEVLAARIEAAESAEADAAAAAEDGEV